MFTVRYPNGQAVQYNTANFLKYENACWQLYTESGGDWIASIQLSAGAMVECVAPCKVNNAMDNELLRTSEERRLSDIEKDIRAIKRMIKKKRRK